MTDDAERCGMGSSPRWRGRLLRGLVRPDWSRLIPALAGTTLLKVSATGAPGAHPRAGGDDPSRLVSLSELYGSSPRWRGRQACDWGPARLWGLIPALAGTTSASQGGTRGAGAHPRAGGDDACSSPPSSSWWRLIPALAGTTRDRLAAPSEGRAHPRAGGDDTAAGSFHGSAWGSSPRWRGRPWWRVRCYRRGGLIPALAGTTRAARCRPAEGRAHPRAGGDDGACVVGRGLSAGSSPRWRGRLDRLQAAVAGDGLIPALAGTTLGVPIRHRAPGAHPRAGGDDQGGGARPGLWRRAHPRAGGDDQMAPRSRTQNPGSSPRWRGRPTFSTDLYSPEGLIPALAGTTQPAQPVSPSRPAHPRAGGDDAETKLDEMASLGSSPRWRGRHPRGGGGGLRRGLIPALAGTTPTPRRPGRRRGAHPRAGGDDMSSSWMVGVVVGSSPRWRGRPQRPRRPVLRPGLIPALAGTTSATSRTRPSGRAHPRAGGDDLAVRRSRPSSAGSSPRWRGRREVDPVVVDVGGLIPALAGTTSRTRRALPRSRAHPRAGGDDGGDVKTKNTASGSSPRWRGRRPAGRPVRPRQRLIPALAGTTPSRSVSPPSRGAHPRAGGDDVPISVPSELNSGSSPRWRGRPRLRRGASREAGLIPALAGTTLAGGVEEPPGKAHPRAGGDDLPPPKGKGVTQGSSPRWRGRRLDVLGGEVLQRLIPALAGTTRRGRTGRGCRPAHPRAGGDDTSPQTEMGLTRGSSPRWRGRRSARGGRSDGCGLIPALAGTTL